jgi:hypothetical protein
MTALGPQPVDPRSQKPLSYKGVVPDFFTGK